MTAHSAQSLASPVDHRTGQTPADCVAIDPLNFCHDASVLTGARLDTRSGGSRSATGDRPMVAVSEDFDALGRYAFPHQNAANGVRTFTRQHVVEVFRARIVGMSGQLNQSFGSLLEPSGLSAQNDALTRVDAGIAAIEEDTIADGKLEVVAAAPQLRAG